MSKILGAVVAMNLLVLSSFAATGVSTFLFVRWLTGRAGAAAIAGGAVAFQAAQIFNAATAPDFAHLWVLPLLAWRMFVLRDRPSRINGLWAGAAGVVAVAWNPYYLLMGSVALTTLAVANLVVAWRRGALRSQVSGLLWALPPLVAAAAVDVLAVVTDSSRAGVRDRPAAELYLYSSRLGEYFDPPNDNALFGWLHMPGTRPGVDTHFYLGLTVVVLAAIGVASVVRGRSHGPRRANVFSIVLLGVVAAVWSGPPTMSIGSFDIRLPSWYVMHVTTTWRIYGRFGIIVTFAVGVLAGVGIAAISRHGPVIVRGITLSAIALLLVLDLRVPSLEFPVKPLEEPPIYAVLRDEPAGGVAEYPIYPLDVGAYDQLYRQDMHHRRLLNGYASGSTAEARALTLTRLDDETAQRLAALGVRYVVYDTTRAPYAAAPAPGMPTGSYRLVAEEGKWQLYEIAGAGPAPPAR
jgi:hypothetical protein